MLVRSRLVLPVKFVLQPTHYKRAPCRIRWTYSEGTAKQRPKNFLGALSNSGTAVRLYSEGRANGAPYSKGQVQVVMSESR
jgi:hypothetical protein